MGKQTFAKMQKLLEENGLPGDTPALLAEAVATPSQKLIKSTISKLAKSLKRYFPTPRFNILWSTVLYGFS